MNSRIVAVWSCSSDKAEAFAKKYGGKTYHTVEEAINAPEVECVYIALTADVHAQYVRKCIENHKPVLCEKPFAVNAEEAEGLYDLAKKEGVYLAEAMWTWHNDVALKVKQWVSSGRIGRVTGVECVYLVRTTPFSDDLCYTYRGLYCCNGRVQRSLRWAASTFDQRGANLL